jgi:hypothetical protein
VRGEWQVINVRHEEAEAVLLDEVVQLGQLGFGEGSGYVHRRASHFTSGCSVNFLSGSTLYANERFVPRRSR